MRSPSPTKTWWDAVKTSFGDAKRDLSRYWKRHWKLQCSFLAVVAGLLLALTLPGGASSVGDYNSACVLNGVFTVFHDSYSLWSITGFFQISLAFGKLTFGQAKVIDVIWDVVVGRGGQAVLAFFSWRVFACYMSTSMELKPVTFTSFRAVFIENTPSAHSIFRLIRDFSTRKSLRSKVAMVFMITSMIFVLSFPTLASSMSGYVTGVTAAVRDYQNDTIPFEKFRLLYCIIHDGDRIGETKDYAVTYEQYSGDPIPYVFDNYLYKRSANFWETAAYVATYRSTPRYINSTFGLAKNTTLGPPTLNISVYIDDPNQHTEHQNLTWFYSDEIYPLSYIRAPENGLCQNTQDYRWGFSFIQLFVIVLLLLEWSIGTMIMFVHARATMHARGRTAIDGEHKSIINLAAAMQKELDANPLTSKTEDEIKKYVQDARGGGISYPPSTPLQHRSKRKRAVAWMRGRKWWLVLMVLQVVVLCLSPLYSKFVPGLYIVCGMTGSGLGNLFALVLGTTTGSRFVLTLVPTFLSFVASIAMFFL